MDSLEELLAALLAHTDSSGPRPDLMCRTMRLSTSSTRHRSPSWEARPATCGRCSGLDQKRNSWHSPRTESWRASGRAQRGLRRLARPLVLETLAGAGEPLLLFSMI